MANDVEIPVSLDTKALLASLANIEKSMGDMTKKMQSQFEGATKSVGNSFEKLGSSIAGSMTVGGVAATLAIKAIDYLADVIKNAVTESLSFNRALIEIETILPKNTALTKDMVKQLEDLSTQFGTAPTAQAKAFYQIMSAGVTDTADATDLLVNSNKLATGGLADIAGVIDTLTTVYNVYGREVGNATDASDSLFKTVQLGKTTISELQSDIGRVLPIAKTFGLSLDEVGASLVMLTNSGLKTREAVSYLTALLVGISRNGKELGSTMNSTAIQTDGFSTVIQRLIEKSQGSNDVLIKLIGTSEGVRAIQALNAQGLSKYNTTLAEYADKAGVAGEASKKILDKDLGKQFDILSQNLGRVSREMIGMFTPAVDAAVRALNGLFVTDVTGDVDKKLENTRKYIESINAQFKIGTIPLMDYTAIMNRLNKQLTDLSNAADTAVSPMITQVRVLQAQAQSLQKEITSLKLGFDGIKSVGAIEASLKIGQLEDKLKGVNAQIVALQTKKVVAEPEPKVVLTDEQKKSYGTLLADTQSLNEQLLAEQANYNAQSAALATTNIFARKEIEINATYDAEFAKLTATQEAELAKSAFIKDEEEKRLTQSKINADFALKAQVLADKTSLDKKRELDRQKILSDKAYQDTAGNLLQAGLVMAKDGSDLQKGLLITQAVMNTYAGATRAYAETPFPASVAISASIVALGLANVAKIAGAKFATGGIVGGNSTFGDKIPVNVNSQEMILTRNQQAELFQIANGKQVNSPDIASLIMELRNTPIVVMANGRELARLMRDESRSGFQFT